MIYTIFKLKPEEKCTYLVTNQPRCEQGFYCDEESKKACPEGTYGATTGLLTTEDCTPCDPKKYCSRTGLQAPEADCDAGYYCRLGAVAAVAEPDTNSNGECYTYNC